MQIERLHWSAMYFGSAALDASLDEIVSIKLPQMLTLRWPVYSDQFSKSKDRSVSFGVSRSRSRGRRYLTLSLGVIALSQDRDGSSALLPAPPIFNRHTPSVDLYLYRLFNPVAIAVRHGHGQGHTPLPSPVEHTTVTRLEAVVTELQAAQTVSFKRVGTCEIDHQGWLEAAA